MSMAGVLAYRPDRSQAKLIFQTKPGSYNTESLIEFLTQLRRHLRGKPVILIWDGLSAHRSKDMKAWLATQQHWLRVEALPGYAHDLNPMELVWGNLKATELANLCPDILDDATPPRTPACTESAAATSCVSTSWTIPAFASDRPSLKYRKIFKGG
jgi:transposase